MLVSMVKFVQKNQSAVLFNVIFNSMFLVSVVRKCEKGVVYEKPLQDRWNREVEFQLNDRMICCAINKRDFVYQTLSSEADYYHCCTG